MKIFKAIPSTLKTTRKQQSFHELVTSMREAFKEYIETQFNSKKKTLSKKKKILTQILFVWENH